MFIVYVTPIVRNNLHTLSYFTPQKVEPGMIVSVPLRNKEVPALVLKTEDAQTIKSILRTNTYETRKLREQTPCTILSPAFLSAIEYVASYYAAATGSTLKSFVPAAILEHAHEGAVATPSVARAHSPTAFEKLVLQLPYDERVEKYITIARGMFAQQKSVIAMTPTIREAHALKAHCSRGIEQYTYVLDSSRTKKQQLEMWNEALSETHPVFIITTPGFVGIPRTDVGHYIIEREISSSYKQQKRPYADARVLVEQLAREYGCPLMLSGTTVSLAVHKELRDGFATECDEHARKLRSRASLYVVDSSTVRTKAKEKRQEFPVLSPESLATLRTTSKKGERSFVFAARRGIAAHTVCNDCAHTVRCGHCRAPVILHEQNDERALLCHRCGARRDAHETCARCGSWNLSSLGIGIERVADYIRERLPDTPLFVVSHDTAPTPARVRSLIDAFYKTDNGILLGTERALSQLSEKISCSVMSSIDSLLAIPDFRIEEKLFGIIITLLDTSKHAVYVETTDPDNVMLKHARNGSISEYADDELSLRKQLHYPPYTRLVRVSSVGTRSAVIRDMQQFLTATKTYNPRIFKGFLPAPRGCVLHALLRIPIENWPDADLVTILESLPPSCTVDVDPERML